MYAIEYISNSCSLCKLVEDNLKESGIKFITKGVDNYRQSNNKIRKVPYTEFFSDNGTYIDCKIGLVSVADIHHIMNVYDK